MARGVIVVLALALVLGAAVAVDVDATSGKAKLRRTHEKVDTMEGMGMNAGAAMERRFLGNMLNAFKGTIANVKSSFQSGNIGNIIDSVKQGAQNLKSNFKDAAANFKNVLSGTVLVLVLTCRSLYQGTTYS